MKKWLLFILLLALLLHAAACRQNTPAPIAEATPVLTAVPTDAPTPSPSPTPTASPTPTPTPTPTAVPITDPVITLIEGETLTVSADFTFTDPGFSAVDCFGNDLTERVITEGEVVSYLVGSYTLTYTVTDDEGRTGSAVRNVEVVPVELPEIVMPPEKTVYLTFDDGPCSNTEMLLKVLKKYNVKATFFVIGDKPRKDVIAHAYADGHSIGVHCYTHILREIYADEQAYFADFLKVQEVIKEQTGSYARIFRFPGGSGNNHRELMQKLSVIMENMGYRYFDWNAPTGDTSTKPYTVDDIRKNIVNGMRKHPDYAIVLQHDISYISLCAVEPAIQWGLENGYTFLPLDLTSPVMHTDIWH